ncbi:MAG: penicillin-binding protein 2 [Candidatus Omnitrophota bacterium]
MFDIRKNIFKAGIYASFIFLIVNLFCFQVIRHPFYKQRSMENRIRIIPLEAPRGMIFDSKGNALVENRLSFNLAVIPQEVKGIDQTLSRLSQLSGIPKNVLYANYKKNFIALFLPVAVAQDIDKYQAFSIEERIGSIPGAILWTNPLRSYKYPNAISHVVGYIGKMDEQEYGALKDYGYKMREYVGKAGIEKYYNSYLRGENGGIQVEVNATSRQTRQLGCKQPKKGKDIHLTIDTDLQNLASALLKDETGAFIVMEAKSGKILALASSPDFDPNIFVEPTRQKERIALLKEPAHPIHNRAISAVYPPGSVFKVAVSDAALSSNKISKYTTFNCGGTYKLGRTRFHCWKKDGHGSMDITHALINSCNIFFYNTGRIIGPEIISQYAAKFKLGQLTGVDLPSEAKGVVPSPLWKRLNERDAWYAGDTLNFAIGQGFLLVTPIQILRMISFIANKGFAPTPYLVEKIEDVDLQHKISDNKASSEEKARYEIIHNALFGVVNEPNGTGQRAKVEGLAVCAKTGTAQSAGHESHAWFAGYLPEKEPKISFVIFIEHGGSGGQKPAELARILCKYLNENGYL